MATVDQRLVRIEQALEEFPDFPQPGVLFRYIHTIASHKRNVVFFMNAFEHFAEIYFRCVAIQRCLVT